MNLNYEQRLWTKVVNQNLEQMMWTDFVNKICEQKLWAKALIKCFWPKLWTKSCKQNINISKKNWTNLSTLVKTTFQQKFWTKGVHKSRKQKLLTQVFTRVVNRNFQHELWTKVLSKSFKQKLKTRVVNKSCVHRQRGEYCEQNLWKTSMNRSFEQK